MFHVEHFTRRVTPGPAWPEGYCRVVVEKTAAKADGILQQEHRRPKPDDD
jgi:hypothetical protein